MTLPLPVLLVRVLILSVMAAVVVFVALQLSKRKSRLIDCLSPEMKRALLVGYAVAVTLLQILLPAIPLPSSPGQWSLTALQAVLTAIAAHFIHVKKKEIVG